MRLEFTLTRADHITFNKIARSGNWRNLSFFIIAASTLGALILIDWSKEFWESLGSFQFVAQIGVIFAVLYVLRKIVRCKAEERCEKEFFDSNLADPITITFDDDGLTSEQPHQKTIWKWSAFHRISVENRNIYLWFGTLQAVMIPARSFGRDAQRNDLVEYLVARIG